jgi:D-lactate dehydrogenase
MGSISNNSSQSKNLALPPGSRLHLFGAKSYDHEFFESANRDFHFELLFHEVHITPQTIEALVKPGDVVCAFVNDDCRRDVLAKMAKIGCRSLVLRSAGFNHVDLAAAKEVGVRVGRVPAYSPYAVAEHTVALVLSLNRKIHRAYNRVREGNFNLEGLLGFDLHRKTIGVIGTGKIGYCVAKIFRGFGCEVLAVDIAENENLKKLGVRDTVLEDLLRASDVISLHCPLTEKTHHLINEKRISLMKTGAMLINTSRGALIDTKAVIAALKTGKIGHLGIDVYEEESGIFFDDQSSKILQDDVLARLMTFSNVLVTGHQAFFTIEALRNIAEVTLCNARDLIRGDVCPNEIFG